MRSKATLHIYGSAACILLDEPDRTSLDIDVAGPYSVVDQGDLRQAAETAGIPVNPDESYAGDHIEWVGPLRLCLQPPLEGGCLTLWQGARLQIRISRPTCPCGDGGDMFSRAKLQSCYELGELLDAALLLHQALPSEGYASQRALTRLALYQAKARAFGTVRFLENLRQRLGRGPLGQTVIPGWMVRDIGLPALSRKACQG